MKSIIMLRPAVHAQSVTASRSAVPIHPAPRPAARKIWNCLRAVLAITCALEAGVAAAQETPRAAWVIGLPNGYVMMEHQAITIEVSAEDVARGVVEVPGGSRLVIKTGAPSRYALDFLARGTLFNSVEIEATGTAVELGPRGGTMVHEQVAGRRVVALNYRFTLAPGTAPGTYAFPVALAVRNVVTIDVQNLAGDRGSMIVSALTEPRSR